MTLQHSLARETLCVKTDSVEHGCILAGVCYQANDQAINEAVRRRARRRNQQMRHHCASDAEILHK